MTVKYRRKVIYKKLILGSLFFIPGILFAVNEPDNFFRYGFILVGLLHLISGVYQLKVPYLRIENNSIIRGGLIRRTLKMSEVKEIRKFAGDYTLFTSEKKMKINSEYVRKSQRAELNGFLRSLEIPFEETPSKTYNYS